MTGVMLKLAVMLGTGLLARHVTLHVGRAVARRTSVRVPKLCAYATAGCTAGVVKLGLSTWTPLTEMAIWVTFGTLWGVIVGLLLPLDRRRSVREAEFVSAVDS